MLYVRKKWRLPASNKFARPDGALCSMELADDMYTLTEIESGTVVAVLDESGFMAQFDEAPESA